MIRTFPDFKECLKDISYIQQALYRRLCSQISPQSNMKSEMDYLLNKFLYNHENLEMDPIQNLKNIAMLLKCVWDLFIEQIYKNE
ncbi:hypothetical protein T10_6226 [Trichinella papuae]|uniref:Uncharacterized protein n=1 Tax=Trichinella papuae TaxID=268474 RepID=A0A0V1MQR7_9BILA|nr:hypothetical protein T10_6226 [Trichinella papuae]